jgi:hypothetical protein
VVGHWLHGRRRRGASQDPDRLGWYALDSDGRKAYFSDFLDDPASVTDPAGHEQSRDPLRFNLPVFVELDQDERYMLMHGLLGWGGPAYGSDALAVAMGFQSIDQVYGEAAHIVDAINKNLPLSIRDWTRALVATEFAFMSTVLGTGCDQWTIINGGTEEHWFRILRRLQGKLPAEADALQH